MGALLGAFACAVCGVVFNALGKSGIRGVALVSIRAWMMGVCRGVASVVWRVGEIMRGVSCESRVYARAWRWVSL